MTLNLSGVRTGMKTMLATVDGLNLYDYEAQHPQLPAAVVRLPQDINVLLVFGATHWNYLIDVTLFVGLSDDVNADNALEALLAEDGTNTTSAIVALKTDQTLGGACQTSVVTGIGNFGLLLDGTAIGCNITLQVMT
jgi:hypothetical protein